MTDADFSNAIIRDADFSESNLTQAQLESTASWKNKNLSGVVFFKHTMSGWNFAGQNLSNASFIAATLTNTDFTGATITGAVFSGHGFTKEQLYSTASYQNKDLTGVYLDLNDLSSWNFKGQSMQNANLVLVYWDGADITNADLRGANLADLDGDAITKNTIWNDGVIKNFAMTSNVDSFSIRKYTPASEGGAMISAKIDATTTISGGAELKLEQGAKLDIVNNAVLTVGEGSFLLIDTDKSGSTMLTIESGASLIFDGGSLVVNLVESISEGDALSFSVMGWDDDSQVAKLDELEAGKNLFLTINGATYNNAWYHSITNNQLVINISSAAAVPEPAEWAAILGAIALGFAAYRGRK